MNTILDVHRNCDKSYKLRREEIHVKFLSVPANTVYQTSKIRDQEKIYRSEVSEVKRERDEENQRKYGCFVHRNMHTFHS